MTVALIRGIGVFLVNLFVAVMGTTVLEGLPYRVFKTRTPGMYLIRDYLINVLIPFGLGYSVYLRWRPAQWKWVGAAGLMWLGLGVFRLWAAGSPAVFREISGISCVYDRNTASCWYYYPFLTAFSLRAICYAGGALCCLRIGE